MHTLHLATACLISPDHQLLVVRKRGSSFWMLPGGKIDAGETAPQALQRELQEELEWSAANTRLTTLGHFENRAANEADTRIKAQVFVAQLADMPTVHIAAEIEAMQWLPLHASTVQGTDTALAPLLSEQVLPALRRTLATAA